MDCTLVTSDLRHDMEIAAAMRFGISPQEFQSAHDEFHLIYGIGNFTYERLYLCCLRVKPGLNPELVDEWHEIVATPMLYPDALAFLDSFPKEELVLLTAGERYNQNLKIEANNLRDKFSKIIIAESPKAVVLENPPADSFFLDDSPREIDAM